MQQNAPHARYILLDELRGVAAVAVLIFHIGTRADGPTLVGNGFLAVDFFFMLSGFVIAEAYEKRMMTGMGFAPFVRKRLIRMLPLAVLGTLLGTAYLIARWYVAPDRSDPLDDVLLSGATSVLLIPKFWYAPATHWELFPNGPLWSLFFEVVINVVWAALLFGRKTIVLAALVLASGIAVIGLAHWHGTMDMGWEWPSFDGGVARVVFGFTFGLLLHRLRHLLPSSGAWAGWLAMAALVYIMALPVYTPLWTSVATVVLPPPSWPWQSWVGGTASCRVERSWGMYPIPLYAIHVPLLSAYAGGRERLLGTGGAEWWALILIPATIIAAWLALKYFDEPVRAMLSRRFDRRQSAPAT